MTYVYTYLRVLIDCEHTQKYHIKDEARIDLSQRDLSNIEVNTLGLRKFLADRVNTMNMIIY